MNKDYLTRGHWRPPNHSSRNPAKFWTKESRQKALTMAVLICKLSLIVIIAP